MNIGVHCCEPYPNYAIDKIVMHHTALGDKVQKWEPLLNHLFDIIYCSSIFTFTDKSELPIDERWVCGGTGFDIYSKLPSKIEVLRPKKNYGFCSRGCIRNCKFCVVPQKEGFIKEYADIYEIWDGDSKEITLQDNNILAIPDHFYKIAWQIKKENIKVDFNQGLDMRLLDIDAVKILKKLRHFEYRFAFDSPAIEETIIRKTIMLKNNGIKRSSFYVLVGYDTTIKEDFYRLNLLKALNQNAYVMRYRKVFDDQPDPNYTEAEIRIYNGMAAWANQHNIFHGMTFEQFLETERGHWYKKYYQEIA
ncbi:radical SAM protein [Petroclostridium sp. X23]|uniref:radical SAM protein n=1 Tax=Petroclostridium sp. X23 TaxID=3045146 RepID=UPI0024AE1F7B|nr:radical SAM protein [Petroclostridium sp. X23]WHH58293.1 radical SAM protein [Petroclostridium sp. X23]